MKIFAWMLIFILGLGAFFAQTHATETAPELTDRERLIAEARMDTASELEQRIVADGLVTTEEYEEAVNAFMSCMNDQGFDVTTFPDPYVPGLNSYDIQSGPPEADDPEVVLEMISDCSTGTNYLIEAIYSLQITNPDDEDHAQLVHACLTSHDLLTSDITAEQLDEELQKESPDLPFDIRDEQVSSCLANPSQNGLNGNPLQQPSVKATPESTSMIPTRQQQVAEAQQNPESELEERILADGVITNAEYEEAVSAYQACMADAGYEVKTSPAMLMPGMYQYEITFEDDPSTPTPDSDFEKLQDADIECSIGTTYTIEAIYGDQISNPDDLPFMDLTLTCLVSKDLVEAGTLTPDELETMLGDEDADLPFDMWDMEVISCLVNPSQNGLNGNPLIEVTPVATPTP